jgi:hypothetical protein
VEDRCCNGNTLAHKGGAHRWVERLLMLCNVADAAAEFGNGDIVAGEVGRWGRGGCAGDGDRGKGVVTGAKEVCERKGEHLPGRGGFSKRGF